MKIVSSLASVVALSLAGSSLAAVQPPKIAEASIKQLATPLPFPYDESSGQNSNAAIDAAFARAKLNHKRVIVSLGGNWCGWCRILEAVTELPDAKPFMKAHFEVVNVSITPTRGKVDHNLQVLQRLGVKEADGFPYLVVADANGRVLHQSSEVTDDAHQTPQSMMNWFASWAE